MKKGIIAISLLLTGALLITPITNAISNSDTSKEAVKPVKVEQTTAKVENVKPSSATNDNTTQTNDIDNDKTSVKENVVKEDNNKTEEVKKEEQSKETSNKETTAKVENKKEEVKENKVENTTEEVKTPAKEESVKEDKGMSKKEAEAVLDKYIKDVEKDDFTYTYQGDENTFEAIKEKGIRGYVFLPNVETDMAYLVDKDTGNIYFFHPSGYFELLQ